MPEQAAIEAEPDTICALASGAGRSGVAVIRISGPATRNVVIQLGGSLPQPRRASLRKLAASKGWPVLQFTRPVTLRSRIPVKPTLAALTVGTALTLGGAIWFSRRRRLGA